MRNQTERVQQLKMFTSQKSTAVQQQSLLLLPLVCLNWNFLCSNYLFLLFCLLTERGCKRENKLLCVQIFLEPEGRDTPELYVQGFSTGLPERLQLALLHTLPGGMPPDLCQSMLRFLMTSATAIHCPSRQGSPVETQLLQLVAPLPCLSFLSCWTSASSNI